MKGVVAGTAHGRPVEGEVEGIVGADDLAGQQEDIAVEGNQQGKRATTSISILMVFFFLRRRAGIALWSHHQWCCTATTSWPHGHGPRR